MKIDVENTVDELNLCKTKIARYREELEDNERERVYLQNKLAEWKDIKLDLEVTLSANGIKY